MGEGQKKKKYEPYSRENWWKSGLIWGVVMFLLMDFVVRPYIMKELLEPNQKLIDLIVWSIGGVGYGGIMRFVYKNYYDKK